MDSSRKIIRAIDATSPTYILATTNPASSTQEWMKIWTEAAKVWKQLGVTFQQVDAAAVTEWADSLDYIPGCWCCDPNI